MELASLNHIEPENLGDLKADLFITTLSHESRSTKIARMLERLNCRKIALYHEDQNQDFSFGENRAYFQDNGFEFIRVLNDVPDVGSVFEGLTNGEVSVMFDCTSMPPRWYFEFFSWLGEGHELENVTLRLVYTLTGYVDEVSARKVKGVKDFLKTDTKSKKRKKALILGLGHEPNVSEAIHKIIKPDLLFLYYTDPPVDRRFVEQVFVNNHALINATPIRNLVAYPINNAQMIYQSIIDTILPLRTEYDIILIPQGPKIFSVTSMLVYFTYPDTVISHPVFKRPQILDREPCGEPVILDIYFEGEE